MPGAARGCQDTDEFAIVEMRRLVGQEHLQAAHTRCHHLGDLVAHDGIGGISDDLVEAVVDHRLLRSPMVLGQRVADTVALELRRERDDAGGASRQARGAARDKALLIRTAVRPQLLDMAVRIDSARHHVKPPGVQRVGAIELLADRRDAATAHADIGSIRVTGRHHCAAADHQVVVSHALPPVRCENLGDRMAHVRPGRNSWRRTPSHAAAAPWTACAVPPRRPPAPWSDHHAVHAMRHRGPPW